MQRNRHIGKRGHRIFDRIGDKLSTRRNGHIAAASKSSVAFPLAGSIFAADRAETGRAIWTEVKCNGAVPKAFDK